MNEALENLNFTIKISLEFVWRDFPNSYIEQVIKYKKKHNTSEVLTLALKSILLSSNYDQF